MSGVVKAVKKVFKKIKENKILKTIAVAAAVWFTVGTATAYFAAPEAGLGAAMSSSASSMWSTTTQFFGAEAAANGANQAATEATALLGEAGATDAGTALAADLSTPISELAAEQAFIDSVPTVAGGAGKVSGAPGSGLFSWVSKNPVASMMLGQAGVGAYSGYLADKEFEREDERYKERGLMGFDYYGNAGGPGVVRSQTPPPADVTEPAIQAAAPQGVVAPQVARPAVQQVAVSREELPKLKQQGQIVHG